MKLKIIAIKICTVLLVTSCGKEFLEVRREAHQVVPQTITDYQALLDKVNTMNEQSSHDLANVSADEYIVSDEVWQSLTGQYKYQHNAYVWNREIFAGREDAPDWDRAYQRVSYANLALDVVKIEPDAGETEAWNNVRGCALFHRAWAFYQLAQLFCKPYDPKTAAEDPGIPLRTDYDVTINYDRGTVELVYERIIKDLQFSTQILPITSFSKMRPTRPAAHALLSRVFLQTHDFHQAELHADRALELSNTLLDFNEIEFSMSGRNDSPFPRYAENNEEVLFYSVSYPSRITHHSRFNASPRILELFQHDDLRKKLFFNMNGRHLYLGSYAGNGHGEFFTGFTTAELYLVKAECLARKGSVDGAMSILNHLLAHRYDKSSFTPQKANNASEALKIILVERVKELYMRGVRWEDLRRLKSDGQFETHLVRKANNMVFELPSNDSRWTFPIPDNEIKISGLKQNNR